VKSVTIASLGRSNGTVESRTLRGMKDIAEWMPPQLRGQLYNYARLMRVDRPVGYLLLLWPTLWALWIAGKGHPDGGLFVVFVLGVFVMRSAGCVLNDYVDRNIDPYVERTRDRPIASGAVAPAEALTLFAALGLVAVGLAAMLNRPAQLLAVVGAGLTIAYPYIKRFVSVPQFVLGAAFGIAVPMAFAAQTGGVPRLGWLIFATALVWAVIYDTFYAMVDREDDRKVGVKSTAILFGDLDLIVIAGLQLVMLAALVFIGLGAELGPWYYLSVVVAACLMLCHLYLARNRDPAGCFAAFGHNHYIGLAVFIGIVLDYTFAPTAPM
jgi:4-hydroxybenzoate polyprenyltransferase